jgi:hypothetical protein
MLYELQLNGKYSLYQVEYDYEKDKKKQVSWVDQKPVKKMLISKDH